MFAFKCHCRDCQRTSGGGFMGMIWVATDTLRIAQGELTFYPFKAGISGRELNRGFCPECGSNVLKKPTAYPQMTHIVASSLDDPSAFKPTVEMWRSSAQPWDLVDERLLVFDTQPTDDEIMGLMKV